MTIGHNDAASTQERQRRCGIGGIDGTRVSSTLLLLLCDAGDIAESAEAPRKEPIVAIGAIFQGQFSEAQYRQVKDRFAPDNRPVQGLLYHIAGPTEDGFCVVEVWESQERLQQFFNEELGQVLQEVGMTVQPQFFEIVNTMQSDR